MYQFTEGIKLHMGIRREYMSFICLLTLLNWENKTVKLTHN